VGKDNYCVNCKFVSKSFDHVSDFSTYLCKHTKGSWTNPVTGVPNYREASSVRIWDCEGGWFVDKRSSPDEDPCHDLPVTHKGPRDNAKFIPLAKPIQNTVSVPVITFDIAKFNDLRPFCNIVIPSAIIMATIVLVLLVWMVV